MHHKAIKSGTQSKRLTLLLQARLLQFQIWLQQPTGKAPASRTRDTETEPNFSQFSHTGSSSGFPVIVTVFVFFFLIEPLR